MKKSLVSMWMILAAIVFVLSACGESESNGDSKDTTNTSEEKVYKVGTDAAYAPMEYIDDKGDIVGIDVDVVNAIAEQAGIEVTFDNVGWEPLFTAVKNGEVDIGMSSITINDERKETYDFTDPYFEANQLILVKEDAGIESLADLKDKKVAVQINTTGHEVAKKLQGDTCANILAYENLPIAIQEMLNGNAVAVIGDNAVVLDYVKNNPKTKFKTIEDDSFEKEYYGLMVKKGNKELVDKLNKAIQELKDNGKLKEITGMDME